MEKKELQNQNKAKMPYTAPVAQVKDVKLSQNYLFVGGSGTAPGGMDDAGDDW